jgi:hypothetical protein
MTHFHSFTYIFHFRLLFGLACISILHWSGFWANGLTSGFSGKENSVALVWYASKLYRPSDRRFSAKLVPAFADRGCRVVSATDPHGRIFCFLDRSRYYFFQIAPQLYSRGRVDPVSDPLLLRKSGNAGNWTRDLWICSQEPQRRSGKEKQDWKGCTP